MQLGALPFEYFQHLGPGGRVRRTTRPADGLRVRRGRGR
jgi:hypothetical protein